MKPTTTPIITVEPAVVDRLMVYLSQKPQPTSPPKGSK